METLLRRQCCPAVSAVSSFACQAAVTFVVELVSRQLFDPLGFVAASNAPVYPQLLLSPWPLRLVFGSCSQDRRQQDRPCQGLELGQIARVDAGIARRRPWSMDFLSLVASVYNIRIEVWMGVIRVDAFAL